MREDPQNLSGFKEQVRPVEAAQPQAVGLHMLGSVPQVYSGVQAEGQTRLRAMAKVGTGRDQQGLLRPGLRMAGCHFQPIRCPK